MKKNTKRTLLLSALSMLCCIAMLIGTTFAWFTDSVTSGSNIIKSGNLDLKMYWTDDLTSGTWHDVDDPNHNTIFSYDNWEPGYTDVKYVKLKNEGSLALNYKLHITPQGAVGKLAEVINVFSISDKNGIVVNTSDDLKNLNCLGLLSTVLAGDATANGTLLAEAQSSPVHPEHEVILTFAMNMLTTAGNEYQGESVGNGFSITALATQASYETDSFGKNYDTNAKYPELITPSKVTVPVTPVNNKVPAGGVTLSDGAVSATVPEGTLLKDGASELTLTVTPLKSSTSKITTVNQEILIPVDVHIEGVSENNTTPIVIELGAILPTYLNMGNYKLFHVENGVNNEMKLVNSKAELNTHNTYMYNPETGEVAVGMATFSEVVGFVDTSNAWDGGVDTKWYTNPKTAIVNNTYKIYNADQLNGFAQIVGGMANGVPQDDFAGKTVMLMADIDLNDGEANNDSAKIFYPIGYYNDQKLIITDRTNQTTNQDGVVSEVQVFAGTFDGNGHTIANFYQNTWEMFGDYNSGYPEKSNYYKDAMGLFAWVDGTVKNLTVDNFSSDGEFTPTGVIAAYAGFNGDATFQNIAITNCNPRVYNTGNGGIVGIGGNTTHTADKKITFKNITVDNSNKITALWGSWDVACGGLMGMYRGNVDSDGNATGDTVSFENCHVAAQIDVYNDVCANYQYYAYRYAGMIIGSVRHNTTNATGRVIPNMAGISATGCTVNYGTWNDYYYCEFEKNSMASYSEDYQFSRVEHSELNFTDSNANGIIDTTEERASVTGCKHNHTANEDKQAVYLPFHQLFTGYSWGVSSIGLEQYSGIVTDLDIIEGEDNESVQKFKVVANPPSGEIYSGREFTVGELFEANGELSVPIVGGKVEVFVSTVDEYTSVDYTYTPSTTGDWKDGKVKINSGSGEITISITDYYFCKTTTLTGLTISSDIDIDMGEQD